MGALELWNFRKSICIIGRGLDKEVIEQLIAMEARDKELGKENGNRELAMSIQG